MLTPTGTGVLRYSYPMGDTPAVCLTQDIPPSFRVPAPCRARREKKEDAKEEEEEKEKDGKRNDGDEADGDEGGEKVEEEKDKIKADKNEKHQEEDEKRQDKKEEEKKEGEKKGEKDEEDEKETKGKQKQTDQRDDEDDNNRKDPINILLLGCGDLRKILFTLHHDGKSTRLVVHQSHLGRPESKVC